MNNHKSRILFRGHYFANDAPNSKNVPLLHVRSESLNTFSDTRFSTGSRNTRGQEIPEKDNTQHCAVSLRQRGFLVFFNSDVKSKASQYKRAKCMFVGLRFPVVMQV